MQAYLQSRRDILSLAQNVSEMSYVTTSAVGAASSAPAIESSMPYSYTAIDQHVAGHLDYMLRNENNSIVTTAERAGNDVTNVSAVGNVRGATTRATDDSDDVDDDDDDDGDDDDGSGAGAGASSSTSSGGRGSRGGRTRGGVSGMTRTKWTSSERLTFMEAVAKAVQLKLRSRACMASPHSAEFKEYTEWYTSPSMGVLMTSQEVSAVTRALRTSMLTSVSGH